jgi:hypothetical protein
MPQRLSARTTLSPEGTRVNFYRFLFGVFLEGKRLNDSVLIPLAGFQLWAGPLVVGGEQRG